MSTINTTAINVNYPVPGVNNNSQGFRDNFASIVNNLNAAGNEITDLQNKVVVKQALLGTTINNDMANTLISNASTRGFRATTYNLGNALAGTVLVDVSLGDVQYGTVAANTTINFGSWAPTGTQSNVQLNLSVSNANAVISFPSELVITNDDGVTLLENFANVSSVPTITVPNGVTQLNYLISSTDCGNTLYIQPINRPRQSTQIQQKLISPKGFQGDVNGDIAVGPSFNQLSVLSSNTGMSLSTVVISNTSGGFTCSATSLPLAVGQQLRISGTAGGTGSISGYSDPSTYYIIATNGTTNFQLSTTSGGSNITTTTGTPTGLTYKVNNGYLNVADTTQLYTDLPIVFTGTSFEANITSGTTYYVRNVSDNTYFTVSSTIGGANVNLAGGSGTMYANPVSYVYVATDSYNSSSYGTSVTQTYANGMITLSGNTGSLSNNVPIIFAANMGGLVLNTVYYVKSFSGANITVSLSRSNGVADTTVTLSSNTTATTATFYVGNDIWKRLALQSW